VVYVSFFLLPFKAAMRTLRVIGRLVPAVLGLILLAAARSRRSNWLAGR
jgi:hypothetical protein